MRYRKGRIGEAEFGKQGMCPVPKRHDALDRLTRLDQAGQTGGNNVAEKRIGLACSALDQFTSIVRYKDTAGSSTDEVASSAYRYDSLNRLTGLAYTEGGVNLFTPYAWSYDSMSRIAQLTSTDGTSDYSYDPATQLTGAVHTYQTNESYSYDANGNRTNTGYSTGINNQLLSDGVYDYLYDDEGNRTKKTEIATGEATEYEWDHRNRLVKVTHLDSLGSATQTLDYKYLCSRQVGSPEKGEIFFSRTCRSARGAGVEGARCGATRAAGSDCSLGADQASLLELAA